MPTTPSYSLTWDGVGEKRYETGTKNGVVYPLDTTTKTYNNGYAWNGLTAVNETPSGAEATDLYADDIKYASMRSAETFAATIEAYTYPPEFAVLDGTAEIAAGVSIGQQARGVFGFSYVSTIGDDVSGNNAGYKLHLIYGLTASPSEKSYATISDSPDAITFSWEAESTPVSVTGHNATSQITIDSTKADATKLAALKQILYGTPASQGTEAVAPRLPLPDEVATLMAAG